VNGFLLLFLLNLLKRAPTKERREPGIEEKCKHSWGWWRRRRRRRNIYHGHRIVRKENVEKWLSGGSGHRLRRRKDAEVCIIIAASTESTQ